MALLVLSFLLLIDLRCIFGVCMRASDPKAYAQCAQKDFFDRWFFISLHRAVRDQYVKIERRKVRFRASARAYFVTNIALHIALALVLLCEIAALFWPPLKGWRMEIYTAYYCLLGVAIAELGIITRSEDRRYYKKLNGKRG